MSAHLPASETATRPHEEGMSRATRGDSRKCSREPLLFTPEEAATVLRIGRTTVYALMKAGELRPVHIGRSCRLARADLERYVHRLESPPPSPTRPRRRGRTNTNQRGLFELARDPVDRSLSCGLRGSGCQRRSATLDAGQDHGEERSMTDPD